MARETVDFHVDGLYLRANRKSIVIKGSRLSVAGEATFPLGHAQNSRL